MAKPECATLQSEGSVPSVRAIPFAPGYFVSACGKVYGKRQIEMIGFVDEQGYHRVGLRIDGKRRHYYVHVLVIRSYVGDGASGKQVRHLDGNPRNNCLDNLVWGTPAENTADKLLHGTVLIGENNPNARLSKEAVDAIRHKASLGENTRTIAAEYAVTPNMVRKIVRGTRWSKSKGRDIDENAEMM